LNILSDASGSPSATLTLVKINLAGI